VHLVLFQPEIPQNVGTLIRFTACMGIPLDIIEPCGFLFTDKHLKRSGMDYQEMATVQRFLSWQAFCATQQEARRIAVVSRSSQNYTDFAFAPSDLLIMGQESSGLPPHIIKDCHETVSIPMMPDRRSLNLAIAAAIVTTEALRQTHLLPRGQNAE
jgi:tRNA (cytidine/uridine-2'-O-)-methyltransferase